MTNPTAPASEVLRGLEVISALSNGKVEDALRSLHEAAKADATAEETAIIGLGEKFARTVMDLAKSTAAPARLDNLLAIRALADRLIAQEQGVTQSIALAEDEIVSPDPSVQSQVDEAPMTVSRRIPAGPKASPSVRVDLFGISVLASRKDEADQVIADARASVAQNKKANPYESYRGKNSWCKSLFIAAYTHLSSMADAEQTEEEPQTEPAPPRPARSFDLDDDSDDAAAPSPALEPVIAPSVDVVETAVSASPAPRQSISRSGPLRSATRYPPQDGETTIPAAPQPSEHTPLGRVHGLGVAVQTMDLSDSAQAEASKPPSSTSRQTFFKRKR